MNRQMDNYRHGLIIVYLDGKDNISVFYSCVCTRIHTHACMRCLKFECGDIEQNNVCVTLVTEFPVNFSDTFPRSNFGKSCACT